jgi:hypothetical protein
MPPQLLKRGDSLKEIEKDVKNKFRWDWLDFEVEICGFKVKIGDSVCKRTEPGLAFCTLCSKDIKYGGRGRAVIVQHLNQKDHQKRLKAQRESMMISVQSDVIAVTTRPSQGVTLKDRVANQEVSY